MSRYGIEPREYNGTPCWAVLRYTQNQGQRVIARYKEERPAQDLMKTLNENTLAEV
jgi:hypothetical protein